MATNSIYIEWNLAGACTASVWKATPASAAILPRAATGCTTPVSLFAIITEISWCLAERLADIFRIDQPIPFTAHNVTRKLHLLETMR